MDWTQTDSVSKKNKVARDENPSLAEQWWKLECLQHVDVTIRHRKLHDGDGWDGFEHVIKGLMFDVRTELRSITMFGRLVIPDHTPSEHWYHDVLQARRKVDSTEVVVSDGRRSYLDCFHPERRDFEQTGIRTWTAKAYHRTKAICKLEKSFTEIVEDAQHLQNVFADPAAGKDGLEDFRMAINLLPRQEKLMCKMERLQDKVLADAETGIDVPNHLDLERMQSILSKARQLLELARELWKSVGRVMVARGYISEEQAQSAPLLRGEFVAVERTLELLRNGSQTT